MQSLTQTAAYRQFLDTGSTHKSSHIESDDESLDSVEQVQVIYSLVTHFAGNIIRPFYIIST